LAPAAAALAGLAGLTFAGLALARGAAGLALAGLARWRGRCGLLGEGEGGAGEEGEGGECVTAHGNSLCALGYGGRAAVYRRARAGWGGRFWGRLPPAGEVGRGAGEW
jgi:hypothetical protein